MKEKLKSRRGWDRTLKASIPNTLILLHIINLSQSMHSRGSFMIICCNLIFNPHFSIHSCQVLHTLAAFLLSQNDFTINATCMAALHYCLLIE